MSFDLSLVGFNQYLGTHAGRDKVGKLVHYGARGMTAQLEAMKNAAAPGTLDHKRLAELHDKMKKFYVRLMDSRRTVRWLSSLGIIIALRKGNCPWTSRNLWVVAQLGLLWWHWLDHVRWLQQVTWLPGDQLVMKRISFAGFTISSVASLAYFSNQMLNPPPGQLENDAKESQTRRAVLKHAMQLLCCLHISELFMTSEILCGICGAGSAAIDIYETFPRKKKEE